MMKDFTVDGGAYAFFKVGAPATVGNSRVTRFYEAAFLRGGRAQSRGAGSSTRYVPAGFFTGSLVCETAVPYRTTVA